MSTRPELPRPYVPRDEENPHDYFTADQVSAYAKAYAQFAIAVEQVRIIEQDQLLNAIRDLFPRSSMSKPLPQVVAEGLAAEREKAIGAAENLARAIREMK